MRIAYPRCLLAMSVLLQFLIPIEATNAAEITIERGATIDFITIKGEIVAEDVSAFRRLAIGTDNAVVILSGPGGYLSPALKIGEIIRLKGFGTFVPGGEQCTSSCALIWVAGVRRFLARSSRVGFHASYIDEGSGRTITGVGNALVGRYLTLLNLPEKAVAFATLASPDEIAWIDPADRQSSGIEFEVLSDEDDDNRQTPMPRAGLPQTNRARGITAFEWSSGGWTVQSSEGQSYCFAYSEETNDAGVTHELMFAITRHSDDITLAFTNDLVAGRREGMKNPFEVVFMTGEDIDNGWGEMPFTGNKFDADSFGWFAKFDRHAMTTDLRDEEWIAFFERTNLIAMFSLAETPLVMTHLQDCLNEG